MEAKIGDVFQINEKFERAGWIGAFVLATEVKSWGVMGFVHALETHERSARAYIRVPWEQCERIGKAVMVLAGEPDDDSA